MGRASAAGEEGADPKGRIHPTSTLLYLAPKAGTSAERHILHTVTPVWFRCGRLFSPCSCLIASRSCSITRRFVAGLSCCLTIFCIGLMGTSVA
jgi:hypothetical protein